LALFFVFFLVLFKGCQSLAETIYFVPQVGGVAAIALARGLQWPVEIALAFLRTETADALQSQLVYILIFCEDQVLLFDIVVEHMIEGDRPRHEIE